MKKTNLLLIIILLIFIIPKLIYAQENEINILKKYKIKLSPAKKVFFENDTANFKVTVINNSDSVITISRCPSAYCYDYFDAYPIDHKEDIYTFLLKKSDNNVYKPFFFSVAMEDENFPVGYLGDNDKSEHQNKANRILMHNEKISIKPGDYYIFLIDLFSFKQEMPLGDYKARIGFFITNKRPYILVKSNWVKFSFK